MAMGLGGSTLASAQSLEPKLPVTLTYGSKLSTGPNFTFGYAQSRRDTWNTVLLVSGIVMIVGIVQDESTLILLGGAGVIVSLVQLNSNRFASHSIARGVDLVQAGPISLGFSPFGQMGLVPGYSTPRPSLYAAATFKF
jgi:hypothetical protein